MSKQKWKIPWLQAAFIGSLPLLGVLILCALQGQSIFNISLLHSQWNDELFYYKQVEAILEYGYPQGFFGFNESHAEIFSFAAWSPILVLPWILWGIVFGWGLSSPMMCNVVIMMIVMFFFGKVIPMKAKNVVACSVLYLTSFFFHRYVLSGMAEAICMSLIIGFVTICYLYLKTEKIHYLYFLVTLAMVVTLMRPYLLMLLLFPFYFMVKHKKKGGVVLVLFAGIVALGIYGYLNRYLAASYFEPLFNVRWLEHFKTGNIMSGCYGIVEDIYIGVKEFLQYILNFIVYQDVVGGLYVQFIIVVFLLGISLFLNRKNKDEIFQIGCFVFVWDLIMFVAILLMYHVRQGSRHLLLFTVLSILILSSMEIKMFRRVAIIGVIFVFSFLEKPYDSYLFDLVPVSEQVEEAYESVKNQGQEKMILTLEEVPSFDNTILWVLMDQVENEQEVVPWQLLYGVPSGMGISCSEFAYVIENFEHLQSKYIAMLPNGELEKLCIENEKVKIVEEDKIVIYQLRQ